MSRAYNVVDADGHILEPLDLWVKYIDPKFRDRAPKIVKGENGKERLVIEEHEVGISRIGAVGARQGIIETDTMTYKDGKPGGFDPHKRIPDMDADGIDAAFLYPSLGLFPARSMIRNWRQRCAAPTTAGSPTTASPIPNACLTSRCCRCRTPNWQSRRCALPGRNLASRAGFCGPTRITAQR
jgi:hypothetical protein